MATTNSPSLSKELTQNTSTRSHGAYEKYLYMRINKQLLLLFCFCFLYLELKLPSAAYTNKGIYIYIYIWICMPSACDIFKRLPQCCEKRDWERGGWMGTFYGLSD